jgi:hypothetical protein
LAKGNNFGIRNLSNIIMYKRLFYILLIIIHTGAFAQENWILSKDMDGIKVYTKTETGSCYKSFKAEMQSNCKIEDIVSVLKDVKRFGIWVADTKEVKLLKMEDNDQYHYIETSLPWPFKSRDMVYHFQYIRINSNQLKVIITGIPDYINPKGDIIRMKKANGFWLLTSLDSNKTTITYQLHVEPGGTIPAWLANVSVIKIPFSTLTGLRNVLAKLK